MAQPPLCNAPAVLIEIGSNQVAIVTGPCQSPFTVTQQAAATLRLGGQLTPEGELPAAAWQALQQQLLAWQPLWAHTPATHRLVVGTQVLREARNRADWVHALHQLLGCEVRIIDGLQEAAWGYAGAMLAHPPQAQAACLVVDIGGRSTEVSRGHTTQWVQGLSLPVGAVSWSQRYFAGEWNEAAFAQAHADACAQFAALQQPEWQQAWTQVYGVAGVAQALGHVLVQLGAPQHEVHAAALQHLRTQLCTHGRDWLAQRCQLPPDMAPMLGGCISTMQALLHTLGLQQLHISPYGLRHAALQAHVQALQTTVH